MKNEPEILYHYCSLETLTKIVRNNTLRLADISKANDSQELYWFINQCRFIAQKTWIDYVNQLEGDEKFKDVDGDWLNQVFETFDYINSESVDKCWAICFSEKADSLSQWRGYADDGKGVSLGLSTDFMKQFSNTLWSKDGARRMLFDKVEYSSEEARNSIVEACKLNDINATTKKGEVISKLESILEKALIYAPLFKHESFMEEAEWRIAIIQSLSLLFCGIMPNDAKKLPQGISLYFDYMTRDGDLVSFIDLKHERLCDYVKEIWIGPKSRLTEEEVMLFLISKGWLKGIDDDSIMIYKSESTYK